LCSVVLASRDKAHEREAREKPNASSRRNAHARPTRIAR
jgi:hypothetical protein